MVFGLIVFGLIGFRTNGFRTNGFSDQWAVGAMAYWTNDTFLDQ